MTLTMFDKQTMQKLSVMKKHKKSPEMNVIKTKRMVII